MQSLKMLIAATAASLSACAPVNDHVVAAPTAADAIAAETISVSVGPCFGFCPVYKVAVSPDGVVHFTGERHTAVLGDRQRKVGTTSFQALAKDLAPFRPADGSTARVDCMAAVSDTSAYTITWTRPTGETTTATHQRGCTGGPGKALDAILTTLPERLGIAGWAKQTTRSGVSRG